jgi:phosphate:Na+ symporter
MGQFAITGLEEASKYLQTKAQKHADSGLNIESAINNLDRKITDYLVLLSAAPLSPADSEKHSVMMDSVRDIERIGDHFENVIELVEYQISNKVKITGSAMKDLEEMFELTITTVKGAISALDHNDIEVAKEVVKKENQIDAMERSLRKKHILRINEGECTGQAGIVYVDIVSNLERIGDHAVNIAEAVLGEHHL